MRERLSRLSGEGGGRGFLEREREGGREERFLARRREEEGERERVREGGRGRDRERAVYHLHS